ncbi:SDR family oxidoreductase [Luteolibacter sp. GHJ8]|uniref:SDR family oxidoreductase n=1 Tax=Luteolibacter rhizosphaerae TaxID=2989719 RepID=A0ABT3G7N4_9BACT|nr:SDR family oxidoreductase [Luteolibacter rhizosphaerae]MCW1915866.1 SDR family oxidoreductase [Luteolibacter rhizosphaerae]
MKETALVTGCTSGIGLHLAHEFAAHGHPLVLVAPDASELRALTNRISAEFGVAAVSVAKDLEHEDAAEDIFYRLQREGTEVDILVNNAGHGFRGKSWEIPLHKDISMVRLNIEAILRMTKLFLPPMLAKGSGRILNTAPVAGFEPGPMLNVYHSTKAFVLSYSEGLSVELEGTGVSVTALCPGPTDTDFFPKADMIGVVGFQKGNLMAPQEVAKAGYSGVMEGELLVIPGAMNKALVAGRRVLTEHAQAKLNEAMYQEVPPEKQTRARGDKENQT